MKFTTFVAAPLLLAAASAAHAVAPGSLGAIDDTLFTIENTVAPGVLFDSFDFTVGAAGTLFGAASALAVPGIFDLPFFSVVLQDAANVVIGTDANPSDGFSFALLSAGEYTLTMVGLATGSQGGAYSGTLYAMTVPEPQTYAMLAGGLGIVGFVAARRRRQV